MHRDVTPRNILVAPGDRAYLADFGVARTITTKGMTKTGFFIGNLDYAAPEQIEGKSVDSRTDIYALGGVLFTCLTGRMPYERESDVQLMYAHLNDQPPEPSAVRPELPRGVDQVVAKAMARIPQTASRAPLSSSRRCARRSRSRRRQRSIQATERREGSSCPRPA